jgi:hypothetical protein
MAVRRVGEMAVQKEVLVERDCLLRLLLSLAECLRHIWAHGRLKVHSTQIMMLFCDGAEGTAPSLASYPWGGGRCTACIAGLAHESLPAEAAAVAG